jgi:hypothetical protein
MDSDRHLMPLSTEKLYIPGTCLREITLVPKILSSQYVLVTNLSKYNLAEVAVAQVHRFDITVYRCSSHDVLPDSIVQILQSNLQNTHPTP